jgi:prepilin-type N-terminal cleavage/methylation domain-containing protein
MRIRIRQDKGIFAELAFSMVEILVAVAVLGIMFVSLYSGLSSGFAVVQLARENLRATQILQEKMETIRLYTWDQINTPGFIATNFVDTFYANGSNASSGLAFTGRVTIAKAPILQSYSNELKQVTIQLEWVSADVLRRRQMQTYVTRNGLQNYIY